MACNAACVTAHALTVLEEAERKFKMLESAERIRARFAEEASRKAKRCIVALPAVIPTRQAKSRRGGKARAHNALAVTSKVIRKFPAVSYMAVGK
jgi:hypothetical protein